MQRNMSVTLAPADAVANSIALAQAPGAAGNLNLNGAAMSGGNVTLDIPRRLGIKSTGDETGRIFTVTGVDRCGNVISEKVKGPAANATVGTLKGYASGPLVISIDGAAAGNITVGTTQTVSSPWLAIDRYDSNGVGFDTQLFGGAITYSVECTADEPFPSGNVNPQTDVYLAPFPHADFTNSNAGGYGAFTTPITAMRITLTAFATGASAKMNVAPGTVGDA